MRLSEIKGEKALDMLADLMDPAGEIFKDKRFVEYCRSRKLNEAVKIALKYHKKSVIEIMAYLDEEDPATYEPNMLTIPFKLLEIVNDKELLMLFRSQVQNTNPSSGPATESIEANEN